MLLGAGVRSALDRGGFSEMLLPLEGDGRFAGVTIDGADVVAAAGFLLKKPAMLCCFGPGFCVPVLPVFLGGGRGVLISLPSMPLAMVVSM